MQNKFVSEPALTYSYTLDAALIQAIYTHLAVHGFYYEKTLVLLPTEDRLIKALSKNEIHFSDISFNDNGDCLLKFENEQNFALATQFFNSILSQNYRSKFFFNLEMARNLSSLAESLSTPANDIKAELSAKNDDAADLTKTKFACAIRHVLHLNRTDLLDGVGSKGERRPVLQNQLKIDFFNGFVVEGSANDLNLISHLRQCYYDYLTAILYPEAVKILLESAGIKADTVDKKMLEQALVISKLGFIEIQKLNSGWSVVACNKEVKDQLDKIAKIALKDEIKNRNTLIHTQISTIATTLQLQPYNKQKDPNGLITSIIFDFPNEGIRQLFAESLKLDIVKNEDREGRYPLVMPAEAIEQLDPEGFCQYHLQKNHPALMRNVKEHATFFQKALLADSTVNFTTLQFNKSHAEKGSPQSAFKVIFEVNAKDPMVVPITNYLQLHHNCQLDGNQLICDPMIFMGNSQGIIRDILKTRSTTTMTANSIASLSPAPVSIESYSWRKQIEGVQFHITPNIARLIFCAANKSNQNNWNNIPDRLHKLRSAIVGGLHISEDDVLSLEYFANSTGQETYNGYSLMAKKHVVSKISDLVETSKNELPAVQNSVCIMLEKYIKSGLSKLVSGKQNARMHALMNAVRNCSTFHEVMLIVENQIDLIVGSVKPTPVPASICPTVWTNHPQHLNSFPHSGIFLEELNEIRNRYLNLNQPAATITTTTTTSTITTTTAVTLSPPHS